MKKDFHKLILFVLSKKKKSEKLIYLLKLMIYFIPLIYSLSSYEQKDNSSASQAGDDIYPIF